MQGSRSIKAGLPTIAPDLAYDSLEVVNGGMAQNAFTEMMRPETLPVHHQQLSEALLKYCQKDKLATVRIAHYFENGT
jgi:hypothetical protein